jgi:cytochrome c oxidase assembly protein subunit 16
MIIPAKLTQKQRLNNPLHAEPALNALHPTPSSSSSPSPSSSQSGRTPRPPRKNIFEFVPQDELENVRVPRPEGVPEWGGGGVGKEEMAPVVGRRKGDRLV